MKDDSGVLRISVSQTTPLWQEKQKKSHLPCAGAGGPSCSLLLAFSITFLERKTDKLVVPMHTRITSVHQPTPRERTNFKSYQLQNNTTVLIRK
jgi:hypothetical protein